MNFAIDQRVRMKRTENIGVVTRVLPGNLIQVKLDGGLGHIPIPAEALELVSPAPTQPEPAPPVMVQKAVSKSVLRENNGLQLAFDPQLNNEAEPVAFEIYLLNSTSEKIIYELKVLTGKNHRWTKSGILEPNSKKRLDAVEYRWLNEKLSCEVDVRTVLVGGTGPRHFEKVNIKPAQFFSRLVEVPELYREAHLYQVFDRLASSKTTTAAPPPKGPSLKALTKQQLENRPKPQPGKTLTHSDLEAKLEFEELLDLHLSALVPDPSAVPKHQILQLQLKTFDDYLAEAIKLGVDSVFIVHGVGNGVLKRAIHSRLHRTRYIRDFKNEYHHKYGFGATEIIFD